MAHETPTIQAQARDRTGSRYARRLRSSGRLPAVIYGHKTEPVHVSVDEKEILTHLHHGSHVMNVAVGSGQAETCLVKELQYGYLGDNVIHLDFTRVDLDEEVEVNVHIHFVGEPAAAKRPGAILSHDITELPIRCAVNRIPEEIRVDLGHVESTFSVADLDLPPGLITPLDPATPIVLVSFVRKAEEAEVGEAEEVVGAAEPEVITEAKAKDEGAAESSSESTQE
jgi:large subunit ribosomal protein L25